MSIEMKKYPDARWYAKNESLLSVTKSSYSKLENLHSQIIEMFINLLISQAGWSIVDDRSVLNNTRTAASRIEIRRAYPTHTQVTSRVYPYILLKKEVRARPQNLAALPVEDIKFDVYLLIKVNRAGMADKLTLDISTLTVNTGSLPGVTVGAPTVIPATDLENYPDMGSSAINFNGLHFDKVVPDKVALYTLRIIWNDLGGFLIYDLTRAIGTSPYSGSNFYYCVSPLIEAKSTDAFPLAVFSSKDAVLDSLDISKAKNVCVKDPKNNPYVQSAEFSIDDAKIPNATYFLSALFNLEDNKKIAFQQRVLRDTGTKTTAVINGKNTQVPVFMGQLQFLPIYVMASNDDGSTIRGRLPDMFWGPDKFSSYTAFYSKGYDFRCIGSMFFPYNDAAGGLDSAENLAPLLIVDPSFISGFKGQETPVSLYPDSSDSVSIYQKPSFTVSGSVKSKNLAGNEGGFALYFREKYAVKVTAVLESKITNTPGAKVNKALKVVKQKIKYRNVINGSVGGYTHTRHNTWDAKKNDYLTHISNPNAEFESGVDTLTATPVPVQNITMEATPNDSGSWTVNLPLQNDYTTIKTIQVDITDKQNNVISPTVLTDGGPISTTVSATFNVDFNYYNFNAGLRPYIKQVELINNEKIKVSFYSTQDYITAGFPTFCAKLLGDPRYYKKTPELQLPYTIAAGTTVGHTLAGPAACGATNSLTEKARNFTQVNLTHNDGIHKNLNPISFTRAQDANTGAILEIPLTNAIKPRAPFFIISVDGYSDLTNLKSFVNGFPDTKYYAKIEDVLLLTLKPGAKNAVAITDAAGLVVLPITNIGVKSTL
jgi:hypothetical protein